MYRISRLSPSRSTWVNDSGRPNQSALGPAVSPPSDRLLPLSALPSSERASALQKALGIQFDDPTLLREALTHLSAVEDASYLRGAVLVVDDDARLAEITARGLRRLGFDADSGSALRTLRPREVLVFDLSLLAALDAAAHQEVRASRPIIVTGATDPASRALANSLDASDYLVKPIELDELAAAINRRMAEGGR